MTKINYVGDLPVHKRAQFLVFGAPAIEEAEIEEVVATMKDGWLGTGPKAAKFEQHFAKYKSANHVIAFNSCKAALHLAFLTAGLQPGDEVITTPLTFCATVNAVLHAGAVPVLADIDPQTINIDFQKLETALTNKTKAIFPVHFAGRPCEMDRLSKIAERHHLKIIEDCAHAIETEYKGRKSGTFGDFGCFSFYMTKNVVTGEGGMVLTKREEDAARIKMLALHGMSHDAWKRFNDKGYKHYYVMECGYIYNMMDIQAALGIHKLARVERNWERRAQIWQQYDQAFSNLPITLPAPPEPNTRHAYHLYTILIDEDRTSIDRDDFLAQMTAKNIGVGVHYLSIPEHPYYQRIFGWKPEQWPNAMQIGRQTVSLPLSPKLTDEDVEYISLSVKAILSGAVHR